MKDKLFSRLVEHSLNHDSHHSLIASKTGIFLISKASVTKNFSNQKSEEASNVENETAARFSRLKLKT